MRTAYARHAHGTGTYPVATAKLSKRCTTMTRPKQPPGHNCTVAAGQHQRVALPLHSNSTAQLPLGAGDAELGSSNRSMMGEPVACATIVP